jgi:hypothetical protein
MTMNTQTNKLSKRRFVLPLNGSVMMYDGLAEATVESFGPAIAAVLLQ